MTVKLGNHPNSQSPLKILPGILIESICGFAGLPEAKPRPATVAAAAAQPRWPVPIPVARGRTRDQNGVDLTDFSIYRSGELITIPMATPNEHMTGPCWRGTLSLKLNAK